MPKGQDAVLRKKNKINRKRMRRSDSAVSTRIASIVASKRRRLAGMRRSCKIIPPPLSPPTPHILLPLTAISSYCRAPDDPFNDRLDAEPLPKKKAKKPPPLKKPNKTDPKAAPLAEKSKKVGGGDTLSKVLHPKLEGNSGRLGGGGVNWRWDWPPLMTSQWSAEFCQRCCTRMSVVDKIGACASNE